MKIARSFAKWLLKPSQTAVLEPSEYERLLKVERELHSYELELADLSDFVHRMAKRRYTEAYDTNVDPKRRSAPTSGDVGAPPGGVGRMTPAEKRELLKAHGRGPR